jgi:hypothetical protein
MNLNMNIHPATIEDFPNLTSRLMRIEFCSDHLRNFEVLICFFEFERYVYGVISQYRRIIDNLPVYASETASPYPLMQLGLDIYFYTLVWDKLGKVFEKLKGHINTLSRSPNAFPNGFMEDYKLLKTRMEHLFSEFHMSARNEYEHPSFQPSKIGNVVLFRILIQDGHGNIRAHIGKEEYAIVRKEHVDRLNSLWVELIDVFLRHFTEKASSSDLLLLKKQIEDDIDEIILKYKRFREEGNNKEANRIFHQILMSEIHLSMEGIPFRKDVLDKFHSIIVKRDNTKL